MNICQVKMFFHGFLDVPSWGTGIDIRLRNARPRYAAQILFLFQTLASKNNKATIYLYRDP